MVKLKLAIGLVALNFIGWSTPLLFAQSPCTPPFSSFRQILSCIEVNSPRLQKARALTEEAGLLPEQAHQWMNPNLNTQAVYAAPTNPNGSNVQGSILFPLDVWGVQEARAKKAELEKTEQALKGMSDRQETLTIAYLDLHKIRQIEKQCENLRMTIQSFETFLKSFKKRPRLTPEQEATQELMILGLQEIKSKYELFQQESHGLVHDIEIQINSTWNPEISNLPSSPHPWPKLNEGPGLLLPSERSISLQLLKIGIEKEHASALVFRAEKKPIPQLGPFLGWSQTPTESGFQAGIEFQIGLPFVESFAGTENLNRKKIETAQVTQKAGERETTGELVHHHEIYEGSIKALANLETPQQRRSHFLRIEALFRKGLIPGSAYLETLRQDLALRQTQDTLEIHALEAWCHIQTVLGQFERCFL